MFSALSRHFSEASGRISWFFLLLVSDLPSFPSRTPTTKRFLADSQSLISGGSGLISTVNDYWKFAEVLRGRGRCPHSGIRFIGPRTYDFMVSNHLPGGKSMHELTHHPLVKPSVSKGMGMGFGLAVITDPIAGNSNASKGIVHWGRSPSRYPRS